MAKSTVLSIEPAIYALAPSFRRSLDAQNKSPKTIKSYMEAVFLFVDYLSRQGMRQEVANIRREHVKAFIADQVARWRPATAANRYRSLQQFFKWAQEEGEAKFTPMANMRPPHVPEEPPPVLSDDQLRKLLRECDSRDFTGRRDTAIIRLALDTGMRRGELAGLKAADVDLDQRLALVLGKREPERLAGPGD